MGADAGEVIVDGGVADAGSIAWVPEVRAFDADGGSFVVAPRATVEAPAALAVSFQVPLSDFRLRLMDYRDKVVASDDALSADGLEYRLVPVEALQSGRAYTVLIDAELGAQVTDSAGRPRDDWELPFTVAGEVQPEPAPAKRPAKAPARSKKKRR